MLVVRESASRIHDGMETGQQLPTTDLRFIQLAFRRDGRTHDLQSQSIDIQRG